MKTKTDIADIQVENHGTLFLFRPLNADTERYLAENVEGMWYGGTLAVEARYAQELAAWLAAEGFTLE